MRKSLVTVTLALALAAPAAATARASGVRACGLVSSKQAASLGVTSTCKGRTTTGSVGVVSAANWGAPTVTATALALTVNTFSATNNPIWQANMQLLKVMPGHPTKVSGIGSVAYEAGADGGTVATIHFVKGKRVVAFSWYSKKPQRSLKTFTAIAKSIAAQL